MWPVGGGSRVCDNGTEPEDDEVGVDLDSYVVDEYEPEPYSDGFVGEEV